MHALGQDALSEREPDTGVPSTSHVVLLIQALRADPDKAAYYRGLLAPLRRYDEEHHGDLIKTLDTYLRHGGNSTQAADALYLHRNSLRYRLARIKALTALDLDDSDVRLALQVAILLGSNEAE